MTMMDSVTVPVFSQLAALSKPSQHPAAEKRCCWSHSSLLACCCVHFLSEADSQGVLPGDAVIQFTCCVYRPQY